MSRRGPSLCTHSSVQDQLMLPLLLMCEFPGPKRTLQSPRNQSVCSE
jgi:hypothetical protein